jgi:hypothetical protein
MDVADDEGVVGKPDDGGLFSFDTIDEVSPEGAIERTYSLAQGKPSCLRTCVRGLAQR